MARAMKARPDGSSRRRAADRNRSQGLAALVKTMYSRWAMPLKPKSNQFNMRLTDDEVRMLNDLSERVGLTQSDILRQFIRKEHAKTFGEAAPPKRPKK